MSQVEVARIWSRSLSALAVGLLVLSCGGGGGGSSPTAPVRPPCTFAEPPPSFPDRAASFSVSGPVNGPAISLAPGPNCPDLLVLEIRATGVNDLRGIRYTIDLPANLLRFDALRVGPFITENGAVQVMGQIGEILRPANSDGVNGSGQIALVAWVYEGPTGSGDLRFTGEAIDSDGNVIPGVDFIGGSVTINN